MKQVLFVVAVMAQQDAKLYLIRWRSLISGEVDFCEKVLAASPEEAIKIAEEGESSEILELYDLKAKEM